MLWVFLLLAVAVMLLAATNRLEAIDSSVASFFRRVRLAWDYAREDVDDVEGDIREHARAAQASAASGSPAGADAGQPGNPPPGS